LPSRALWRLFTPNILYRNVLKNFLQNK